MTMRILRDVRVVDFSTGIAGGYLAKLLADAGADIIRVVGLSQSAALDQFLHAGKRLIQSGEESEQVSRLLAGAHCAILPEQVTLADVKRLRHRCPRLVVVTLTPWGLRGPWASRPATAFIAEAESGAVAQHGGPDDVPFASGGRLMEWCAGTVGAVGALGAVLDLRTGAPARHVDVSMQAVATHTSVAFVDVRDQTEGTSVGQRPARVLDAPAIEPTEDGWVGFAVNSASQVRSFLKMIGRADLIGTPWEEDRHRQAHRDEWDRIVRDWTRQHSTADIVAQATRLRIPVAPVNDAAGVLRHEQVVDQNLVKFTASGCFQQPACPYVIDGERPTTAVAPTPPEMKEIGWNDSCDRWRSLIDGRPVGTRPLSGLRVLDATAVFAGPAVGQVLRYLGAEVIHLESGERPDSARAIVGALSGSARWWEKSAMFLSNNRDKQSIAVSLTSDKGRAIIRRLAAACDVMVENFAPRVFERFDLDHDTLRLVNPALVHVRMPAFGLSGPLRDGIGYAQTIEQISGIAWRTGYPAGEPRAPRGPCDPLTAYHAAFAVLLGLTQRQYTGRGCAIEAAMLPAALNAAAELIVQYTANATSLTRDGNRGDDCVPQGVYRCSGDENWLALAIRTHPQWIALCEVLGSGDSALDPSSRRTDRRQDKERIDSAISGAVRRREVSDLVDELVARGVPAGEVRDPRLMRNHPQLRGWGYYEKSGHPIVGTLDIPALPFRYDDIDRWSTDRAPLLGEHNDVVLRSVLGMRDSEIDRLTRAGVLHRQPTES
jgi:crotonobetainyl-CoA:carnitine CoA-transferase CaiB-like acyl-CoA transferase